MKLPKFFNVDGTLVKVDLNPKTGEVFGMTSTGYPYPPVKARSEGKEISEEEYVNNQKTT
jgi:hypothetical protein